MAENHLVKECLQRHGSALVFMSPEWQDTKRAVRVQIVDVFALQDVTGYARDPYGTLILEAHPSVAAVRGWSLGGCCA